MYPRDYFQQSGPVEIGTCFVAMPFSSSFDPTFDAIKTAICNDLAFRAIRTDELLGGGNIIADILRGLATSEIVIADLTDRNPTSTTSSAWLTCASQSRRSCCLAKKSTRFRLT